MSPTWQQLWPVIQSYHKRHLVSEGKVKTYPCMYISALKISFSSYPYE